MTVVTVLLRTLPFKRKMEEAPTAHRADLPLARYLAGPAQGDSRQLMSGGGKL